MVEPATVAEPIPSAAVTPEMVGPIPMNLVPRTETATVVRYTTVRVTLGAIAAETL